MPVWCHPRLRLPFLFFVALLISSSEVGISSRVAFFWAINTSRPPEHLPSLLIAITSYILLLFLYSISQFCILYDAAIYSPSSQTSFPFIFPLCAGFSTSSWKTIRLRSGRDAPCGIVSTVIRCWLGTVSEMMLIALGWFILPAEAVPNSDGKLSDFRGPGYWRLCQGLFSKGLFRVARVGTVRSKMLLLGRMWSYSALTSPSIRKIGGNSREEGRMCSTTMKFRYLLWLMVCRSRITCEVELSTIYSTLHS